MGSAAGGAIKFVSSIFGPFLSAPTIAGGYTNARMNGSDSYKQTYGSREHYRSNKNMDKYAWELL